MKGKSKRPKNKVRPKNKSAFADFFHQERKIIFATTHYLKIALGLPYDATIPAKSILTLEEVKLYWQQVAQAERHELGVGGSRSAAWQNTDPEVKRLVSQ